MNQIWLQILAVMIGSSVVKYIFSSMLAWVIIDLLVLGIAYIILRRHPYIDIRKSMIFLSGLTAISVLVDLGILDGVIGQIIILIFLVWTIFGGGSGNNRKWPSMRHKWHK
jgi:uncharacterized membrane protein YfcA